MADAPASRLIGSLTFAEVGTALRSTSVLCLPVGSIEQHGPHLPLNTDAVIAEETTRRIVARWGASHDLWQLPTAPIGLSREHAWAPGTLSLSINAMTAWLHDVARDIVRALPARNLLVVNGHGGNRGLLEALGRELRFEFGLNIGALHLGALISPVSDGPVPEIHAGRDETSVMLALAPHLVRREAIEQMKPPADGQAVRALVLDPAASWPWSSDDPRIAAAGVIGDARGASAAHGEAIMARVVDASGEAIRLLLDNQKSLSADRPFD
jgi:creatinine amidohydrolase/Fe(II)-dependent formamide hydrolase-like protein